QSNLSAALTTYATVLARRGQPAEALSMLNEAVGVAAQSGDAESAGLASLTVVEELAAELPRPELQSHYQKAESSLKHSQHPAILFRLGNSARTLLASETAADSESVTTAELAANSTLEEQVLRYEAELIR